MVVKQLPIRSACGWVLEIEAWIMLRHHLFDRFLIILAVKDQDVHILNLSDRVYATYTTYTHLWFSIVPIQVGGQSTYEAHVFHLKIAKGVECGSSGSPDGHDGGILSGSDAPAHPSYSRMAGSEVGVKMNKQHLILWITKDEGLTSEMMAPLGPTIGRESAQAVRITVEKQNEPLSGHLEVSAGLNRYVSVRSTTAQVTDHFPSRHSEPSWLDLRR